MKNKFKINFKTSFSFFGHFKRFVVFQYGIDTRNSKQLVENEKRVNSTLGQVFIFGSLFLWMMFGALVTAGVFSYFFKSNIIKINIFAKRQPVKEMAYKFGICPSPETIKKNKKYYEKKYR